MIDLAWLKGRLMNIHRPGDRQDVFIFATPRSGSTFLMELLYAQPGMKIYNEPLNIRRPVVRRELGVEDWAGLCTLPDREGAFGRYFDKLRRNALPELNRPLWRRGSRFLSNRLVFKVLHGGEDMVPWFQRTFDARIVLLLRHPIPTVLSHAHYPRLPHMLKHPAVRARFSAAQLVLAERIIADGHMFQCGILDWCLQNRLPLLDRRPDWAVVSYEDLTLHPEQCVAYLQSKLDLDPVQGLDRLIARPSKSTVQSDAQTREFFARAPDDRRFLVEKWRRRVSADQEQHAMDLLAAFDIDCYAAGNLFPTEAYRVPGVREPAKAAA